jgi:hypothetical protein
LLAPREGYGEEKNRRNSRATRSGRPPCRHEGGTVTVRYPKGRGPLDWRKREGEVELNTPWYGGVELRGGTARINADLKPLALRSFKLKGGASKLSLELKEPWGVVPVRLTGGASHVTIRRPAGTAARLRVKGGTSQLIFDGQSIGAVGGYVSLTASITMRTPRNATKSRSPAGRPTSPWTPSDQVRHQATGLGRPAHMKPVA